MSARIRTLPDAAFLAVAMVVGVGRAFAANPSAVQEGTLCINGYGDIRATDLSTWINNAIPSSSQRLMVLTECFGGNTAQAFANQANTAVISATSPGQIAYYGTYAVGATGALTAGATNTGQTVANAANATASPDETPSTGGGLAPASFSLAPVTAFGPIESRHVLIYSGMPGGPDNNDVNERNTIINNFASDPATTVYTVGSNGTNGWDQPGTPAGLQATLNTIGNNINLSGHPANEQFIMYVGDHGGVRNGLPSIFLTIPPSLLTPVTPSNTPLQCFQDDKPGNSDGVPIPGTFAVSPSVLSGANPSFSVFIDLSSSINQISTGGHPVNLTEALSLINPSAWQMALTPSTGSPITLANPTVVFKDLNGNGILGDSAGEGIELDFPMPAATMMSSFFDVFTNISVENGSSLPWQVSDPSQNSGAIAQAVPEPESTALGSLVLAVMGVVARRPRR